MASTLLVGAINEDTSSLINNARVQGLANLGTSAFSAYPIRPADVGYDATLTANGNQLGINLGHNNAWTARQDLNGGAVAQYLEFSSVPNFSTAAYSDAAFMFRYNQGGDTTGGGSYGAVVSLNATYQDVAGTYTWVWQDQYTNPAMILLQSGGMTLLSGGTQAAPAAQQTNFTPTTLFAIDNTGKISTSHTWTASQTINMGGTNNVALTLTSSGAGWGSGIQLLNTAGAGSPVYGIYVGSDLKLHLDGGGSLGDFLLVDGTAKTVTAAGAWNFGTAITEFPGGIGWVGEGNSPQFSVQRPVRPNMCVDPGFELGTGYWILRSGARWTVNTANQGIPGTVTPPAGAIAANTFWALGSTTVPAAANDWWAVSCLAAFNSGAWGTAYPFLQVTFLDGSGNQLATANSGAIPTDGTWHSPSAVAQAPANTASVDIRFVIAGGASGGTSNGGWFALPKLERVESSTSTPTMFTVDRLVAPYQVGSLPITVSGDTEALAISGPFYTNMAITITTTGTGKDAGILFDSSGVGGRKYLLDAGGTGSGIGAGNFGFWDSTSGVAALYVDSSHNAHVDGGIYAGTLGLWTTVGWNVPMTYPLGSAIRTSGATTSGNYLGFGMTSGGWYFGKSTASDGSQAISYMLHVDESGNVTAGNNVTANAYTGTSTGLVMQFSASGMKNQDNTQFGDTTSTWSQFDTSFRFKALGAGLEHAYFTYRPKGIDNQAEWYITGEGNSYDDSYMNLVVHGRISAENSSKGDDGFGHLNYAGTLPNSATTQLGGIQWRHGGNGVLTESLYLTTNSTGGLTGGTYGVWSYPFGNWIYAFDPVTGTGHFYGAIGFNNASGIALNVGSNIFDQSTSGILGGGRMVIEAEGNELDILNSAGSAYGSIMALAAYFQNVGTVVFANNTGNNSIDILRTDGGSNLYLLPWGKGAGNNTTIDTVNIGGGGGTANLRVSGTISAANGTMVGSGTQTFTGNGTFTVPTGVYRILVEVWGGGGGGGGGGSGNQAGGGGGGGGGYAAAWIAVSPGNQYAVTIGGGGGGGTNGNNATGGGNTTFGSLLTANGGVGGQGGTQATGGGGAGGGGSGAPSWVVNGGGNGGGGSISTGNGGAGGASPNALGGGGGSAGIYPGGGVNGNPGGAGGAYGGGGGGGSDADSLHGGGNGGNGAAGVCRVAW